MFLVGGNKQSGSKGVVAVLCGVADSLGEALFVAVIDTAVRNIIYDATAEFVEAVIFVDDKVGVDLIGVAFKTVAAGFIFDVRVDVGIIPKKRRFDTFLAQGINTVNTTGRAASVH